MKQAIYGVILGIVLIFTVIGTVITESRTNRENNVQQSLKRATKAAVKAVLDEQSYTIDSNEQFVAAVAQQLCNNLISNSQVHYDKATGIYEASMSKGADNTVPDPNLKLTLEVVEADYAKGLLCFNVVEEYTNPIGTVGTCEYATTVIFDKAQEYMQYTIQYYNANNIMVGNYIVKEGDKWPVPSSAITDSYHITSWGAVLGGSGTRFVPPATVPYEYEENNMASYSAFYDEMTQTMRIYGNYTGV